MIRNEKEFAVARAELDHYEAVLSEFDVVREIEAGVDPVIARAHKASFASKVGELKAELRDYERLRNGEIADIDVEEIESLGKALVSARIAKGISQKTLAEIAGLKEQQIQRYERDFYQSANLKRLGLIAKSLNFSLGGALAPIASDHLNGDMPFGFRASDFPFLEMRRAGWFGEELQQATRVNALERDAALMNFLQTAPRKMGRALHRKGTARMTTAREAALLAWQLRVLCRARAVVKDYPRFSPLDGATVTSIAKLSSEPDGIKRAIDLLRRHGIVVVVEPHLPRTRIDGAALSIDGRYGVIALTIRYDRIDNFWFVLLHELGHLMRHWEHVVSVGIVDEDASSEAIELIEREADEFAENAILPASVWRNSMVRHAKDERQIKAFASRHSLNVALIAGRIRRERGYREFHNLVGEGEVRPQLADIGYWKGDL